MRRRAFIITVMAVIVIMAYLLWRAYLHEADPDQKQEFPAKATLKFTYWGSIEEKRAVERTLTEFTEAYPWIAVESVHFPNSDYNTKMMAMSASNEDPDLAYMTTELGEMFSRENKFLNLFDFLAEDEELKKDDFLDYIWYKSAEDYAWGVSTAAECFGLYYRKDLLEQAGVQPPSPRAEQAWNWDQLIDAAKKLTLDNQGRNAYDPDFDPNHIVRYGIMFETWSDPLNNFIFSNGGDWVSPDQKRFALQSLEAAEAIQRLADLINVHHVAPSPYESKSLPAMSMALQAGLAAMIVDGQWINLDLGKAEVDFDIGVLPKLKKSVTVGLSGATVIFRSSDHPKEAWLLYKWLSDPSKSLSLYSDGLWMPVLKKWYTDTALVDKWVHANPAAHPPGFKEAMMTQLLNNGMPSVGYYLQNQMEIFPEVTQGLIPVWHGEMKAEAALREIADKVSVLYSQK
ncbi:ABC transporter substrate-binding protein [Paenibacillus methanolicus]|uniref:Multiple sugar transport system substrate-binding protein n=1 Tax=Paenibacillus methanolicus TaxID=582686 RepID=A0A5S5CGH1_9BACL|nr:sugar ABC transporter substrate-binding protein [Paenibacillus methanolicus]TYP77450.1 multiple sugar transport system substrate-binding protein [Paenibacillus methanolicus]